MNILVGDLGGTKTILAVISSEAGPYKPLAEKTFKSANFKSLEDIIKTFLGETKLEISQTCFAIAGPIVNGHAHFTYLNWNIGSENIKSTFNLSAVHMLNDMESLGYSIPLLKTEDIHTLSRGIPVVGGCIAILAPGTGLGEGFLTYEQDHYVAQASEGSHVSFGPEDDLQIGLLQYLKGKGCGHVSYERVCSGGFGIPIIYEYLKAINFAPEPAWLTVKLAESKDPSPVIFNAAQDQINPCALASATLDMFVDILGVEAGNLALKVLSTGGIYLGGGIPPRILTHLEKPNFLEGFRNKGRLSSLLINVPVHVIINPKAGLLGAAAYGLAHLSSS
jgi:glucokinase